MRLRVGEHYRVELRHLLVVNRELAATAAEAPRSVSPRAELWAALEREEDDEARADAALREAAEQFA